ncbi:MAG: ribosome small subunit-dependent GTPase A [Planctomycetia bacterium]|nr:ribosome small subunit-dependent GTPase A [Planctomycetia bacterium]
MGKKRMRTDFRKNRGTRTRRKDWSDLVHTEADESSGQTPESENVENAARHVERISGKGELSRRRTVVASEIAEEDGDQRIIPDVDLIRTLCGRVLSVHGIHSMVRQELPWEAMGPGDPVTIDETSISVSSQATGTPMETGDPAEVSTIRKCAQVGRIWRCTTRRRLWTLASDARHAVVAGDRVRFLPSVREAVETTEYPEGTIERVEPRQACLTRESRKRKHVVVANVDQILIVASAAQPELKPELIDRMILAAEKGGMRPLICVNKCDLVDPVELMSLAGQYGRMDYPVFLVSATTGRNLDRLRRAVTGRETAVVGQSGVGKTSLLRALDPTLDLAVREVSRENEKGRHTTTVARLVPLGDGKNSYMVDTPGIRQFLLWDVIPEEVANYYRDLRPYINLCRWPDCTHTVEEGCAVKHAVADGQLDERRYESYCHLREDHPSRW